MLLWVMSSKERVHFLGLFNFIIMQWFFVRLARVEDDDGNHVRWTLIKVFPLTGWQSSEYRYWGGSR